MLRDAARVIETAVREAEEESPARLAARALAAAVGALGADGGALILMDPETLLFSTGAVDQLPAACCHPFFASELDEARTRTFRRLARAGGAASALSSAGAGEGDFRRTVLEPFGYADELRVVCRDAGVAWGGLSLWRRAGSPLFARDDERALDAVAPAIGRSLRDAVLRSFVDSRQAPGVQGVVVVEGTRVVDASPEARALLHEIDEPGTIEYRPLDHLLAVAQQATRFSTVVGTHDGRWITAHGTALAAGRVAVVLTSATPADLFGTVVAGAGLTTREVEVTRLLCRGLTDAEIARELTVSEHTAHDHVRAVRRKLGVRNRAEVASRIFADHYLDRFLADASVAHSG